MTHNSWVVLRPLLITRVVNAAVWLTLIPVGLEAARLQSLAVSVPLAAWLGVRGYRVRVVLEESAVVVDGCFWSRRIPADVIAEISLFPAARWVSKRGRRRWTPISAFAELGRMAPAVGKHNESAFEQLTEWHWEATARGRRTRGRGPRDD